MCKSSLQQWEGLALRYFSTYWVLTGSEEREKKIGRANWKNVLVIVFCFYTRNSGVCGATGNKEVQPVC